MRQVEGIEPLFDEFLGKFFTFALAMGGQSDKHMRARGIVHAVVEFGHAAGAAAQVVHQCAQTAETAPLLGDGDGKQSFAFFAYLGALGHEAQPVKVHIRATQNGGESLPLAFVRCDVLLDGRHCHGACWLHDAAGVNKHVLDGCTDRVGVDLDVFVHQILADAEGFFTHQLDGRAIGKQAHIIQGHAFACANRLDHGVGIVHLHANYLDRWIDGLDVVGHAGNQPATANGHEHRVEMLVRLPLHLAQQFHGHRALAGNHVRVVKRMNKNQPFVLLQFHGVLVGVAVAIALQHHFTAQRLDRLNFELRCGDRHHDHGARAQFAASQRHTLRMVAGRRTNHATLELLGRELRHFVVRPAQLETEYWLLVFALEQYGITQPAAQVLGQIERRLFCHVIHAGIEDFFQVIVGGEGRGFFGGCGHG